MPAEQEARIVKISTRVEKQLAVGQRQLPPALPLPLFYTKPIFRVKKHDFL